MYRRVVSLLLLPCVLLTQAASLGHCHAGSSLAGHDPRPHIHLNIKPAFHGHQHNGPGGHHHHDDEDDVPGTDMQPAQQPEPLSDHDSDAVFINSVDLIINERSVVDDELAASLLVALAGFNLSTTLWANPPRAAAHWTHPPPPAVCSCPLYIQHLALLI